MKNSPDEAPLYRNLSGGRTDYRSLPDNSPAGATLVSVARAASGRDALIQIATAANVRVGAESPGMFHAKPPPGFSIDLDRKPLLEAIYETCSRAGWTIHHIEPAAVAPATAPLSAQPPGKIVLQPGTMNHGLGIWSTTGPFLFEVVSLNHSVQIPANGGDAVEIVLRTWTEPKLRAFNVAGGLVTRTALDNLGHALGARPIQNPRYNNSSVGESSLTLGLPPDYGRRIAQLSLIDHCFIQHTSTVIEMAWGDTIVNQVVEGMNVSMSTKLESPTICQVTLSVARGERSELDWGDLRTAISDLDPQLLDTAGAPMQSFNLHQKSGDDPLTISFSWSNSDVHGRPRPAGKVVLDIPTDVKWVDVPVEFRDLPLP